MKKLTMFTALFGASIAQAQIAPQQGHWRGTFAFPPFLMPTTWPPLKKALLPFIFPFLTLLRAKRCHSKTLNTKAKPWL